MVRGLYTSGLGMTAQMQRMDVVANNIANADTTAFKRDAVITQSFSEELLKRINDPDKLSVGNEARLGRISQGLFVDTVYTDFSSGNMQRTGGTFDLAIAGSGFFAVSVTDKQGNVTEKYTRDGAFTLSENRTLMTKDGNRLLGENGEIIVPDGYVTIDENGIVKVDDEEIDRIKIVDFQNPQSLRKIGSNIFDTTAETQTGDFTGSILQGHLENSNINTVREMVQLISVARAYEVNQKMVQNFDTIMGKIANDIGRR